MLEPFGQRIARLRGARGWTQQDLADRIAMSRVAVSHLEAGISVASERTVTLLAGVFRLEPPELVDGSSYPIPKAERLPLVAARYTELEHQLALLRRDLEWLGRLADRSGYDALAERVRTEWTDRLRDLERAAIDPRDRALVGEARTELKGRTPGV
jgi:transcriptional regulator with XRE-family HTH domain